jgi:hypothetical protein
MYHIGDKNILNYCDLISPQFVGAALVRCLRTFKAPSIDCQHNFENIYYAPVEKITFQDIRVEILTMDGKRAGFEDSKQPIKVVLHFRRICTV